MTLGEGLALVVSVMSFGYATAVLMYARAAYKEAKKNREKWEKDT